MKGIVLETRGNRAAVLLMDGTFRNIRGRYRVGDTIYWQEKTFSSVRRWAAAAAAVVLLGTGGGFWYDANLTAYGEVSLDVNPSIIYTVNKRSRVLEVRASNENALAAVESLTQSGVRFMPISEAVEKTIGILASEGYMDAENEDYVLVNISADGEQLQTSLTQAVEEGIAQASADDPTMEIRIDHSDRDTARRAAENGMSTGRYAAWEQAEDGSEPETYHEKPVQEIMTGTPGAEADALPEEPPFPEEGAAPEPPQAEPPADILSEDGRQDEQAAGAMPDHAPEDRAPQADGKEAMAPQATALPDHTPEDRDSQTDQKESMTPQNTALPDHAPEDRTSQTGEKGDRAQPDTRVSLSAPGASLPSAQPSPDTEASPEVLQDPAAANGVPVQEALGSTIPQQENPVPASQSEPPKVSALPDAGTGAGAPPDTASAPNQDPAENGMNLPDPGNRNAPAQNPGSGQGTFQGGSMEMGGAPGNAPAFSGPPGP